MHFQSTSSLSSPAGRMGVGRSGKLGQSSIDRAHPAFVVRGGSAGLDGFNRTAAVSKSSTFDLDPNLLTLKIAPSHCNHMPANPGDSERRVCSG